MDIVMTISQFLNTKFSKKILILIGMFVVALIILLLGAWWHFTKLFEANCEIADIEAMRDAKLTAVALWKYNEFETDKYYWYDADTYTVLPSNQEKPSPYGLGSIIKGGSLNDLNRAYVAGYSYNEAGNYVGMILRLYGQEEEDGSVTINVDWVY